MNDLRPCVIDIQCADILDLTKEVIGLHKYTISVCTKPSPPHLSTPQVPPIADPLLHRVGVRGARPMYKTGQLLEHPSTPTRLAPPSPPTTTTSV